MMMKPNCRSLTSWKMTRAGRPPRPDIKDDWPAGRLTQQPGFLVFVDLANEFNAARRQEGFCSSRTSFLPGYIATDFCHIQDVTPSPGVAARRPVCNQNRVSAWRGPSELPGPRRSTTLRRRRSSERTTLFGMPSTGASRSIVFANSTRARSTVQGEL